MFYSIVRDLEYGTFCDRCGAALSVAVHFTFEGKEMWVGRECAKHYGITWTTAVGPMAEDPATFAKAIEIFRTKKADSNYRWPGGWEACLPIKEALGTIAWKRAMRSVK